MQFAARPVDARTRRRSFIALQRPEADEVVELAGALGIHLTAAEARIFTDRMQGQVDTLEAFLELRIEEERPPLRHLERDPGRRAGLPRRIR